MPSNLPSAMPDPSLQPALVTGSGALPAEYAGEARSEETKTDWRRYVAAVLRYKWLVVLVTIVGTAGGVGASRFITPEYVAQATIWIEQTQRGGSQISAGPIRSGQLVSDYGWIDLLRSYLVLDEVVRSGRLYLHQNAADTAVLANFTLKERFVPGAYKVEVDETGKHFTLAMANVSDVLQRGAVGDSIGPQWFSWLPPARELRPHREIDFSITAPRDAARALADNLSAKIGSDGSFMRLELHGANAPRLAATLNAITARYIAVAAELKREKLTELTKILNDQLTTAATNLKDAETALESFRVRTITMPQDPSTPVTPGLAQTANPVYNNFFQMRIERDQLQRDRQAIERVLTQSSDTGLQADALRLIGAVQSTDVAQALNELNSKEADLRASRYKYTDQSPQVQRLLSDVASLKQQTIPSLAQVLVAQIQSREQDLDQRIGSASAELRQIPTRAIEEARLERYKASAEFLYTTLRQRYEEARLAEASSVPDVRILDNAAVPQHPEKNTKSRIIGMAFIGSLGLGIFGALVLDRVDSRVRYPDQVSREMGLTILGAVPRVKGGGTNGASDAQQVVEALRGIRLGLLHAYGSAGPIMLTISSPGPGDGKSFISSNLALAFADAGHKTLLIDGDIRRGGLHRVMNSPRKPGLTDYLSGTATREQIVRQTSYPNLAFIPCGTRTQSGPELLGAAAMTDLITRLRPNYSVILVDSPPLGAGVDPFVLGTVTGNMVMVLRTGVTDREMAEAKLDMLDRLPIRILGAVLNDVREGASYRYYSYYLSGYEAADEMIADAKGLPAGEPS